MYCGDSIYGDLDDGVNVVDTVSSTSALNDFVRFNE